MKAMLFAAGLGTRLKPETLNQPKALVDVGGKPLLLHALEKLLAGGIKDVVVNVHHYPDMIISYLQNTGLNLNIMISDEREKLLDTGGALKKAAGLFGSGNEPILIYNVDVLSNLKFESLIKEHLNSGALATLVVRNRQTQRYIRFDSEKRIVGWINHKTGEKKIVDSAHFEDATEMAFSGIHVVQPDIFQLMPDKERFSMIEFYLDLAKQHLIKGYFDESSFWLDVGKPESLARARSIYK